MHHNLGTDAMNPSDIIDRTFLGAPPGEWLTAILLIAAVITAIYVIRHVLATRLAVIAARTTTAVDDALLGLVRRTPIFLIIFAAFRILTHALELPARIETILGSLGTIALFVQLGLWGNAAIMFWGQRLAAQRSHQPASAGAMTIRAIAFGVRVVLWTILFLVALDTFDIDVTALIAGLGVGGIAIALAVQNILGDLFAALAIVLDKPFEVGDFIQVDEFLGTVQHVGIKTTRVRSLTGEEVIFPNANLLQSRVRNFKRMAERRVVLTIGVLYSTPPDIVEQLPGVIKEVIQSQERVRFDRSHFHRFADSALELEAVYWVLSGDFAIHADIRQAIGFQLIRRFQALGVEFAFPTRTVHLEAPALTSQLAAREAS